MTNIVEQARAVQHPACKPLVNELADEIERLRAALDRAADALEFYDNKAEAQKARRALEPKP